jgi:branched-chain amino acid transport system substrate-binding protein
MKNTANWKIVVLIITLTLLSCSRNNNKNSQPREVTIGAILVLSGDNALWGVNARNAIEMLTTEINQDGGISGKRLRIVYEDSGGDPKVAVTAFRRLLDVNRVPVVLGDMLSSTTLAMAPLANQSETVLMGISCSAPAVSTAGPYVYRVWPSDLYEGQAFAEWAFQDGLRTISIAFLNNDYGNGLRNAFASRFRQLGGSVPIEEGFTNARTEGRSLAAKLRQAETDGIYVVGYYEDSALLVKELRQVGYKGKLLGTSSSIHQKLFQIAGSASEGFISALVNDFDPARLNERQAAFVRRYKAAYGADPDWAATHGGDAIEVVASCLRRGARSGPDIKRCIDQQRTFEGINGTLTFNEDGDVINKPIAVKVAQRGQFITVDK